MFTSLLQTRHLFEVQIKESLTELYDEVLNSSSSSSSPYCVMKAMQLSTIIGMSFLLSCCSLSVFPFPPAAR